MRMVVVLTLVLLLSSCEEKRKPVINKALNLNIPLNCLKLNPLENNKKFIAVLNKLYTFKDDCTHQLTINYKKDIVCNSGFNASGKCLGKFPKSYLKLEVRNGFEMEYSYYIDLNDNVDEDDIKEGFLKLKSDLLK